MDDQKSTSLIKAVACGALAPGVSLLKRLVLTNTGTPGERVVDISVQTRTGPPIPLSPSTPASPNAPAPAVDRTETLRTISVEAMSPLKAEHKVVYKRPTRVQPGLVDLSTFDGSKRDEANAVETLVTSTLTVMAPSGLVIDSVVLIRKVRSFGIVLLLLP